MLRAQAMAFGYDSNSGSSLAMLLCLLSQVPLFLLLVTRGYRQLTQAWSSTLCAVFGMVAITGSTALFTAAFPWVRGGGTWASVLVMLFVVAPLSIVNSIIFTIRAFSDRPKGLAAVLTACVIPLNLIYWCVLLFTGDGSS